MSSKFNINKIKGIDIAVDENGNVKEDFILTDVNKKKDMDIRFIERKNIIKNDKNFYAIGDVGSLKQSIEDVGLKQPLEVVRIGKDLYKLIGGERRLTAIDELIVEGKWNKNIPCVITNFEDIDLPISDTDKEMYSLITTNKEQRKRTDGEMIKEMSFLREIYKKLKREGVESVVGADGETITLKGRSEREILSETLGVSTGRIGEFTKVLKDGSDLLKETMTQNDVSSAVASKIANLPKEEQDEMLQTIKEKKKNTDEKTRITGKDVDDYIDAKKSKDKVFTSDSWTSLTESVSVVLQGNEVNMSDDDINAIEQYIGTIKLIIEKNM